MNSLLALVSMTDVTHVACGFDHVIESFRNRLYAGYKTGEGIDPKLLAQFALAEEAVSALGIVVWPMIEFEADDALATGVSLYKDKPGVEQIVICSPDKDLAQMVSGKSIVCWDRRRDIYLDEEGVFGKFGVQPHSIPDWLALVGDAADGYPGIPLWGAKSASVVLSKFDHIESIPDDPSELEIPLGRAIKLVESLRPRREEALLYRRLATLRSDVPLQQDLSDLEWRGATADLPEVCEALGNQQLLKRVSRWRDS
jgi:5'-3' exonuclease